MEAAEAWCSNGRESYTTLRVGEISEFVFCCLAVLRFLVFFLLPFLTDLLPRRFTLAQGERMYVRFFLPEEYYCRPFHVISRPYYGSVSSFFSTFTAYPDFSTARGWRKVNIFLVLYLLFRVLIKSNLTPFLLSSPTIGTK